MQTVPAQIDQIGHARPGLWQFAHCRHHRRSFPLDRPLSVGIGQFGLVAPFDPPHDRLRPPSRHESIGLGRLFDQLAELSLNKCRFGSRRQLCSLLAQCGTLRRLSFGDTRLPMDHLDELIVACPSLRRLDISLQQEPFSVIDTLHAVQRALHDRRVAFDAHATTSSSTLVIQIATLRLDANQGELLKNSHFCCLQISQRPLFTTVTVDLTASHRYSTVESADQFQSIL
ncbi:3/1,6-mannosyltransferase ALG2,Alpha-1 [Trichinella spiralis]|uniref:3/1,6-mannosyltransferase ALG2,Alpha-1 n=1 Tax=Trichinella spiralis TaxID=6334 RepID=A0ABR3KUN1_TRISP